MPTVNSIKKYVEGGVYHVYNRANNYSALFEKPSDYKFFIKRMSSLLEKKTCVLAFDRSFNDTVRIFAFCLMPTHFHLILHQTDELSIAGFMQSLQLSYSLYRKRKGGVRGRLYESRYKARLLSTEEDLLNVSKYIHNNPKELGENVWLYPYSSMRIYTNKRLQKVHYYRFLDRSHILDYFSGGVDEYKEYVA